MNSLTSWNEEQSVAKGQTATEMRIIFSADIPTRPLFDLIMRNSKKQMKKITQYVRTR